MNAPEQSPRIRRIIVALDASPNSLAALRAAAELANRLEHVEILGIFVEDINLVRLAQLPFVRELSQVSATARRLDASRMERQLRAMARRAQQAMAELITRPTVEWSFKVARGEINAELLDAARHADLVILGKSGWSRRRGVGSTARVVLTDAPHSAMMFARGLSLALPVLVVYDGSVQARQALDVAEPFVAGREGHLTVLIVAPDAVEARKLQSEAAEQLAAKQGAAAAETRFRWLVGGDVDRLVEVIQSEPSCVVVLPAGMPHVRGDQMVQLLERVDCPLLVVR